MKNIKKKNIIIIIIVIIIINHKVIAKIDLELSSGEYSFYTT